MKPTTAFMLGTTAVALSMLAFSAVAFAAASAPVTGAYSKIQSINTYSGDTTVNLEQNPVGCEAGFWMRPTQAGFKEKLKTLEDAAHLNSRIKVVGDKADMWKQQDQHNCRLDAVIDEPVTNLGTNADLDGQTAVDGRKAMDDMSRALDNLKAPSEQPPQLEEEPPPPN